LPEASARTRLATARSAAAAAPRRAESDDEYRRRSRRFAHAARLSQSSSRADRLPRGARRDTSAAPETEAARS
jgi:hypothetical protein